MNVISSVCMMMMMDFNKQAAPAATAVAPIKRI